MLAELPLPRFVDLEAMEEILRDGPSYKRLQTSIKRARRIQSCLSDLAQSASCTAALSSLLVVPCERDLQERLSTESALLMQGITLYARATSDSRGRGERGPTSIAHALTGQTREDHDTLIAIRNRAVAHVYTDEIVDGDKWHQARLFAVERTGGWKLGTITRTIQFHRQAFERLKRQTPVANTLLTARYHEQTNEIERILNSNRVDIQIYERSLFDPVPMFGSRNGVLAALADIPKGRSSGIC